MSAASNWTGEEIVLSRPTLSEQHIESDVIGGKRRVDLRITICSNEE